MCSLFSLSFRKLFPSLPLSVSLSCIIPSLIFHLFLPRHQPNMSASSPPSSSTSWFLSFRFFTRIRRFLQTKTSMKSSTQPSTLALSNPITQETKMETETDETSYLLQKSVKQLHFGNSQEKAIAAKEITIFASKDLKTRRSLASLGVIPSLVHMVASECEDQRRLAVRALIELANGTYTNKAVTVEAGIFSKFPTYIDTLDNSSIHNYSMLLLSISSLSNTQHPISSSEILPFIIGVLNSSDDNIEAKLDCLDALYNLSTILDNVGPLVANGIVHTLLKLSLEKEVSEKALATLGNLVVSIMGKKAMEDDPTVPASLIEIMTWDSKPKCQELSAYILMILAHQSSKQRAKMAQLGIVQVLLELALLGSPLAQKRAMKLLQWFKDERQTRIGAHSGPQARRVVRVSANVNKGEISEGRRVIKKMVKQSLNKNMEVIMRRANHVGESSKLKSLVISSSSKSLPY